MKNFEKLWPSLTESQQDQLQARLQAHQRYANINFKVLDVKSSQVVLRVTQGKTHSANYFDNKRLSEIGKELLLELGGHWSVITRPIPYDPSPTDVVNSSWIKKQIDSHGLKTKFVAHALGIDANTASAYINGSKPLTAPVKAAFFYYFKTL